ncbi:MAG: VirB8/TrbF family protein [Pseudomonadota bacterium]|nr:VirB8/TrbF family protein [Pseudomonadota bacterium]
MSDREDYYAAAKSWAEGQSSAAPRETRIAWRVAAGASVVALLLALALAFLVPLKTVEPYVLTVDRQTGAVESASTVESGKLSQNEAVIQAQLASYVIARETFDATDLSEMYRRVQLMSSRPVAAAYVAQMAATNPESPLRVLNRGDTVAIKIRSVSLINDGAGLVRFTATRTAQGGGVGQPTNFVAAISFGFNGRPLRQSDRYDNPLGFQVTRYRRDVEGLA